MKIRHERPMSDLQFQVRAPLGLELPDGNAVQITDWSLRDFTFPGKPDVLPSKGVLSIPFQGVAITFPVTLKPGTAPGQLEFDGLTGRQRETLAVFYRSILSGKMASTEEVITSLDTPVDLVPMGETEEEQAAGVAKQKPRVLRAVWNVAFYIILSVVIFTTLGSQIWARLTTIQAEQVRVEAPMLMHTTPQGAYVDRVRVEVGDRVRRGERLVLMSDPDHTARMEEIRTDIRDQERVLSRAEERLARHMETQSVARAPLLEAYTRAFTARRIEDFLGHYNLSAVEDAWTALARFDAGYWTRVGTWNEIRDALEEDLRRATEDFRRLKRMLGAEKDSGSAADVVALDAGVVTAVHVFRNQFTARGTPAIEVEADADRLAVGWLDERLAAAVYPGMGARLTVNAGGEKHRLTGAVVEVSAGADPARPGQYGVRLAVLPDKADSARVRALMRPGAPLRMVLDRAPSWAPEGGPRDWAAALWAAALARIGGA